MRRGDGEFMAATIYPNLYERESFGSAPDERDARGGIACWNPNCDKWRWVDKNSIVSECTGCGDAAYEYDIPADTESAEFKALKAEFKARRK
jgi:hypothetical protein